MNQKYYTQLIDLFPDLNNANESILFTCAIKYNSTGLFRVFAQGHRKNSGGIC